MNTVVSDSNVSRVWRVDRLRGFALLGVILTNAPFLLSSLLGLQPPPRTQPVDMVAAIVTWVGFQAKAYLIFAFLFGYSLTLFLNSVSRKGLHPRRTYLRRLGGLLALGVAHAVFLFPGDILVVYAALGLTLLALRGRSDRFLMGVAVAWLVVEVIGLGVLAVLPVPTGPLGEVSSQLANGNFFEVTRTHLTLWPVYLLFVLLDQGGLVGAMFCLGLIAGRRQLLRSPEVLGLSRWRRVRGWGLGLGLPLQSLSALLAFAPGAGPEGEYLALLVQSSSAPILAAGYVATIVLLPRHSAARVLEPQGRMSLTGYLGGSLVLTVVGAGWGLGLFGMGAAAAFGLALATWVLWVVFAVVWHRCGLGPGPLERVLRRVTYSRRSDG